MKNETIITAHVSKDIKPETLEALGEMMTALIKQLDKEKQSENVRTKRKRPKERRK